MKIFIADDSDLIRERLAEMLSDLPDIEIIGQAQETPEAIALIKKAKPDVAILDIRMPGMSGVEVLEIVKKDNPGLAVIMLTNYPAPQYKKRCLDLGADYFFDNSNDFEKIPDVLQKIAG